MASLRSWKRSRTTSTAKARKPRRSKPKQTLKDGSVPEKYIQAQILAWLESAGLLHWRANSGFVHVHGRRISLGPEGISDVVVIIPPTGRFLGLEIKSEHGKVRPVQKLFKARVEAVGGYYKIVRTLAQAMDAVASAVGQEVWETIKNGGSHAWSSQNQL